MSGPAFAAGGQCGSSQTMRRGALAIFQLQTVAPILGGLDSSSYGDKWTSE